MLFSSGYFTAFEGAFLALRFSITTGGAAEGKSSICMWIAKRSLPIWAMIVEVPGSSSGLGNGNTLFLRFVMTTVMPHAWRKGKSPHECLPLTRSKSLVFNQIIFRKECPNNAWPRPGADQKRAEASGS